MKKIIGLLFLLLISCCKSTNGNIQLSSASVSYIDNEGRNTVTVMSIDYGKSADQAIFNAKRLAFQNLFFRGISGSQFNDPLIGINENEEFKKHKNYLTDFYNNRMESFILNVSNTVEKVKGGDRRASLNLKINLRALRKDLKDKQIIKKFGL